MKRLSVIILLLLVSTTFAFSQAKAKKPILMVVPSDVWCFQNGFVTEFDNQGVVERIPDYERALMENSELNLAISKLGELMSNRGFELTNLNDAIRNIKNISAEESLMTSSEMGDGVAESPLDKLKQVAQADIWMQLTYTVNSQGPRKAITFNLQGVDAYTNKQVAAASGTGSYSVSVDIPSLLVESVVAYMDDFNNQLQEHFDDLFENGREVTLTCLRWANSDMNFESEYEVDGMYDELSFIIEDWVADNTVYGRFSTTQASRDRMVFAQVRIPLEDQRGRAMDTRRWARELTRFLKNELDIESTITIRGLGDATVTIGYK